MIRALVVFAALLSMATGASADPAQDCNQDRDVAQKIRGCTEFIRQTRDARQVANAYYNLGNAYRAKNDFEHALASYSKAIVINPRHAYAYNNRGRVYWEKKDYEQAIADQTKAAEVTTAPAIKAHAYYNLGVVYRDKNELDRAIAQYSKALDLKTGETEVNVRAYLNRAVAYISKMEYDRAVADLSKAIEISPKRAVIYYQRAGVLSTKGDPYHERAWACFKAGKAAQGLADVQKSLALRPKDARTLDTRGLILEALGKREEAIADFRHAIALAPNDAEVQASGKQALRRLGVDPDVSQP
jgi:tetratricopeptide (TPR) repeat protein